MSKFRQALLLIFSTIALFISSCAIQARLVKCFRSFQEFAYSGPELSQKTDITLPPPPWKIEATIPIKQVEGYIFASIDAEITRSIGGLQEIWLIEELFSSKPNQSNINVFLVYQPKTQKWEIVSAGIGDTSLFVQDLFVTSDGNIWGTTEWDTIHGQFNLEKVPVLSKFNETSQRFEFAKGVLEIPWILFTYNFFPWPEIVLDNKDIFWIFAKNDGIYRYDPVLQKTEKWASLSGLNVTQAALSPDGSIYFEVFDEKIYSKEGFFRLSDRMLFQFLPKTKEIIPLGIPDEPWPVFSGMLVDQNNRLWLGAIGYREQDGNWHLVHPDPEQFFASAGDAYMMPPTLIFESSDGILWYKKLLGDVRADGTAWYDPRTGKGCMFTNVAANVIEDSERRLWLVAGGKLFKYQLP